MVNKVTLIGNLGRDPEVRHLENGSAVGKFSVATNESYKDKSGEWQTLTEWHEVVVWRNLAERAERDLAKGKLVYVEGKITHRKWQDKEGNDRNSTEIVANTFRLLERRESSGNREYSSFPKATDELPNTSTSTPSATPSTNQNNNTTLEDDDLPF